MKKKTICIDFDGVIHDYSKGWQGEDVFCGMIPNADVATSILKKQGWTIIIYTTRKKTKKLEEWLEENKITYDYINENPDQPEGASDKLKADIYLDDRGISFKGHWDQWLLYEIRDFEPWQERDRREMKEAKQRLEALAALDKQESIWDKGKHSRVTYELG